MPLGFLLPTTGSMAHWSPYIPCGLNLYGGAVLTKAFLRLWASGRRFCHRAFQYRCSFGTLRAEGSCQQCKAMSSREHRQHRTWGQHCHKGEELGVLQMMGGPQFEGGEGLKEQIQAKNHHIWSLLERAATMIIALIYWVHVRHVSDIYTHCTLNICWLIVTMLVLTGEPSLAHSHKCLSPLIIMLLSTKQKWALIFLLFTPFSEKTKWIWCVYGEMGIHSHF